MVPLVAITGLSIFGVTATIGPALNLLETNKYDHAVTTLGEVLMVELQHERRISGGAKAGTPELADQRQRTDEHYKRFLARFEQDRGRETLPAGHLIVVDGFIAHMQAIGQIRNDFDTGKTDASATVGRYSEIIDAAYRMFAPLTYVADAYLSQVARGLFLVSRARELLAREDAIVTAAISDGRITQVEQGKLLLAIGARRQQVDEAVSALTSPHRETYAKIFSGDAYMTLFAMEESLANLKVPNSVPIDPGIWRTSAAAVLDQMDNTEDQAATAALALANEVGIRAFSLPLIAGLVGLLCAAGALVLALRTGRSVVRRLERLRASALSVAHDLLPRAIAALRQPGPVAIDASVTDVPIVAVGTDEVGQVGHAFEAVQRTAIRAAIDEATLRRGISEVFLNIARRSQALLHRQLTLLDRMERRTTAPQELEDLFRLDHMATRMRRHAEALVILAGSAPGRGWRHPVPIIDVVRGATSEIEDYVRVSMDRLPDVRIVGRAVGDLIHLLAELLENATSFAPPHTQVRVHAETVANGLALQVEDRGLGMSEPELADANQRLAEPPAFDPAHSARLGLLVVAKLAARQGITVRLRPSAYGGVTAVVLVPEELMLIGVTADSGPGVLTVQQPKREITAAVPPPDKSEQTTVSIVDGLPKRVRRPIPEQRQPKPVDGEQVTVDLAAAGRAAAPAGPGLNGAAAVDVQRSADEIRSRMSAFQSGSMRGRAQVAAEGPDSAERPDSSKTDSTDTTTTEEGSA
ncbi:sensor histidine kinase [Allorhizocola rhizosphaerae]|uniref:sensor histidine kinase n=1 Tax=Allorhizocola rhizosphaerae TaxID=1872709 RepID=UPI0013C37326|nr:nitrate- and nitrite sensing domain-containing protein [Allorhizocola rhizosphaerae]